MVQASGTIYRSGSKERIERASVKATKGTQVEYTTSDDDGDFSFSLDPGTWTFVALHEDSFPSKPKELDLMQDTGSIRIDLPRLQGTEEGRLGQGFWIALLVTLGLLIALYVGLHLAFPAKAAVGLWDQDPQRFFEVLMWGLAGVLVYKIIIVGWYLRSQRFYREGIVMHIAHIITTPLLVLVAVLLLSLATLSIKLASGNQLTLDLSDPRIMVAVSFLLGTSPWPLWGFIEDTAKRVTGRTE
jgi:hypothetical protein